MSESPNFAALDAAEKENKDFRVRTEERNGCSGSIGHLDLVFYRTKIENISAVTNESILRLKLLFYGEYLRSAAVPMGAIKSSSTLKGIL